MKRYGVRTILAITVNVEKKLPLVCSSSRVGFEPTVRICLFSRRENFFHLAQLKLGQVRKLGWLARTQETTTADFVS